MLVLRALIECVNIPVEMVMFEKDKEIWMLRDVYRPCHV